MRRCTRVCGEPHGNTQNRFHGRYSSFVAIHPFSVSFGVSSRKSETLAGWDAEKSGEQNQPARKNDPFFVLHDGPDQ
jgi:isoleucyl-tRNA synthetase